MAETTTESTETEFTTDEQGLAYTELLEKNPVRAVEKAIRGMLPKNSLGRQQLSKLKVYTGPEHPHAAQRPAAYVFDQVAQ